MDLEALKADAATRHLGSEPAISGVMFEAGAMAATVAFFSVLVLLFVAMAAAVIA